MKGITKYATMSKREAKKLDDALEKAFKNGWCVRKARKCPNCGATMVVCPECGKTFAHGQESNCDNPSCIEVNAPLDCERCGMVASSDLQGVLDFDMKLIPYQA